MLQLILGRAGSGKTTRMYEQIQAADTGRLCLLLVPEQYSFESERALLERLGDGMSRRVRVLSFTRLADMVLDEVGGGGGRHLDEVTRALLMSRALEEVRDRLRVYGRYTGSAAYIRRLLALQVECKQYLVSPGDLSAAGEALDALPALRDKTHDAAAALAAFDALAAEGYADPLDRLTLLARRLPESALLAGSQVYVDGFRGFTAQELAVLGALLERAAAVRVSLCTDTLDAAAAHRFAAVSRTAGELLRLAERLGIDAAPPVRLDGSHRAESASLRAVELTAFLPRGEAAEEDAGAEGVTLLACGDRHDECAAAARGIRRLLRRDPTLRCRDIAVVARTLPPYRGVLEAALHAQGIPCFLDKRQPADGEPLAALVRGALRAAAGWEGDDPLLLVKTGLLGFSAHSAALLEDYTYLWRVTGRSWREEWMLHPGGLLAAHDDASGRALAYLNLLRRRLVRPLEQLAALLRQDTLSGVEFARGVYRYLSAANVPRILRLQAARLDAMGEQPLADRMAQTWELVTSLLDRFARTLGDSRLPPDRLAELMGLALSLSDLGALPQNLDAVQVGAADRMRLTSPRVVWVLGANEGVFPAWPEEAGLLTDRERRALAEAGLRLADTCEQQAETERFFAYSALSAPRERLIVSWQTVGGAERPLPSAMVQAVRRALPDLPLLTSDGDDPLFGGGIESAADAFAALAAHLCPDGADNTPAGAPPLPGGATLRAFCAREPDRLRALEQVSAVAPLRFADPDAARAFFGERLRLSPSKVETYHRCRFAYFCRYGLEARVKARADLDALAFGTLVHDVMQHTLPRYVAEGFGRVTRARADADVQAAVTAYIGAHMGGLADKSRRFVWLTQRLTRVAQTLLWQVVRELAQSAFVPVAYELGIGIPDGEGRTLTPLTYTLPGGGSVCLRGVVDRVDVFAHEGTRYLRVVDYKTGAKEFRLAEVLEGLNLQLLVYLFALCAQEEGSFAGSKPAGLLYMPAAAPPVEVARDASPEEAVDKQARALRMKGLVLDDPVVVRAMERDAQGVFIPARLNKDGGFAAGASIASLAQFDALKTRVEQLLREMGETLHRGEIAPLPAAGTTDACAHCDFAAACGHEADDPVRRISEAVGQEMKVKSGGGG